VVAHRETGEFFRYDQKVEMKLQAATRERLFGTWFPVVRDFELAPGGYQAKMVVRDANSRRIGTIVHEFEVPDLAALRLLARRTFSPESTLYAQFEVYGADKEKGSGMPNVSAGYVIRRKEGGVITNVAPSRINPTSLGRLSRLVGSPLKSADAGDYEFVLTVKDEISGKTLEVREPFTVDPAFPAPAAAGTASPGPAS
jgi:hypothetical protein